MFESYLQDCFMKTAPLVNKENFEMEFDNYLSGLDVEEWIELGEGFCEHLFDKIKKEFNKLNK